MSRASVEYRRLCKCGRTVMTSSELCGPCWAAQTMADFRYHQHHSPPRRGTCRHCGKTRNLTGRDLCESNCARLGLEDVYPVVAKPGRKKVTR